MDNLDVMTYAMALDSEEAELCGDPVSAPEWDRMRSVLVRWLYRDN